MKNTNITLHTTQKKEYVLTGILSLPLHLGERAWIYSYNQTFATSPVQSILEVSENGVVFETSPPHQRRLSSDLKEEHHD